MTLELPPRDELTLTLDSLALILIAVTAIAGNLFICLATLYKPNLRTGTNFWVAALAASDLVRSSIAGPLTIGALLQGRWNYGPLVCFLQGFFIYFFSLVSLLTMAFMSVNRFFRVVKPQLYKQIFTNRRSAVMIAALWVFLALSVSLPVVLGWAEFAFYPGYAACVLRFHEVNFTRLFLIVDLVVFLCPCMLIIVACYYKVSQAVRHHNQTIIASLKGRNGPQSNLLVHVEEIRISRTLFLLVGTFALCWIPTYVIGLVSRGDIAYIPHRVTLSVTYLMGLNSAVNPFIYGAMSRSFRQEFRSFTPRCCKTAVSQSTLQVKSTQLGSQHLAANKEPKLEEQREVPLQFRMRAWSGEKEMKTRTSSPAGDAEIISNEV